MNIRFREEVRERGWLRGLLFLLAPMHGVLAVLFATGTAAPGLPLWARLASTAVFTLSAGLFLWASADLRVVNEVGTDAVRLGFRYTGYRIARAAIRSVRAIDYPVWHFGGWGYRWNWRSGKRAQSVTSAKRAVEVEFVRKDGGSRTVVFSSAAPERIVEALAKS